MKYSGKFLDILKKQPDGGWKIAVDCYNSDSPPLPDKMP
jgi:ketosteroid isomerase-like protein